MFVLLQENDREVGSDVSDLYGFITLDKKLINNSFKEYYKHCSLI